MVYLNGNGVSIVLTARFYFLIMTRLEEKRPHELINHYKPNRYTVFKACNTKEFILQIAPQEAFGRKQNDFKKLLLWLHTQQTTVSTTQTTRPCEKFLLLGFNYST